MRYLKMINDRQCTTEITKVQNKLLNSIPNYETILICVGTGYISRLLIIANF